MATFVVRNVQAVAPATAAPEATSSPDGLPPPGAPPAAGAIVGAVCGTAEEERIKLLWVVLAIAAFLLASGGAWLLFTGIEPTLFRPSSDYTALAGLVLSAAAIERLLEPFSPWLASKEKQRKDVKTSASIAERAAADPTTSESAVQALADEAAASKARLNRREAERALVHWSIASIAGLLVVSVLGLFFLQSVTAPPTGGPEESNGAAVADDGGAEDPNGAAAPDEDANAAADGGEADLPNRYFDLVFTALLIGAGTKPLHDTISSIQARKATAQGAAEKAATS